MFPRSGTQRLAVLDAIRSKGAGGMTDEELSTELQLGLNSVRARRVELRDGEWIKDSGRTRKTSTGNDAVVWVVAESQLSFA